MGSLYCYADVWRRAWGISLPNEQNPQCLVSAFHCFSADWRYNGFNSIWSQNLGYPRIWCLAPHQIGYRERLETKTPKKTLQAKGKNCWNIPEAVSFKFSPLHAHGFTLVPWIGKKPWQRKKSRYSIHFWTNPNNIFHCLNPYWWSLKNNFDLFLDV